MDHDIFRTPHAVTPTLEERETPSAYAHHPAGAGLGETMPMWRVQTEGYTDGTDQLVGIVSRDAGFFDSPDVEWISGGVNTKGPEAVAIGRHGNFLHWGFAASPTYLTDEAQLVFVNALHYITRFDHQTPVARKRQGVPPRVYVEQAIESISDEGYAAMLEMYADFRAEDAARRAAIRARIDAGEAVTDQERQSLDYPAIADPERLSRVRSYLTPEKLEELGEDPTAIGTYLREVLPFMRSDGGWYTLVVDEELMGLGIANDDPELLDRAVALLENDTDADLARSLLTRYTAQSFATPAEWRSWLEENRARLFFTEVGGYVWLADRPARPAPKVPELKPTAASPVAAELSLESLGDGRHALTVHVAILDGWHAYDLVPPGSPYLPLTVALDLPEGLRRDGDWERPTSRPDPHAPTLTLFEGRLAFRCEVVEEDGLARDAGLTCRLGYQVCDERMCLRPTTKELTIRLRP